MTGARMTGRTATTDYAYLSIAVRCVNRGNLLIDEATRRILHLDPDRTVEFDAHSPLSGDDIDRIDACRALVLPGATLLQPEDHPSVGALGQIRSPVVALGVALRSILDVPDVTVARQLGLPVGSRDPFTHRSLRRAGIRSRLVGCQTLFFGRAQQWLRQDGPIVITLGLGDQRPLERCALACAELGPTVVLAQAPGWQREAFDHPNVTVEAITGTDQTLALLGGAAVVVTGRLHILLAAVALGVPMIFMGGWYDSRYSLIEHLRVPVEPPVPLRIRNLAGRVLDGTMPRSRCLDVAENLRQAMRQYLNQVAEPLGLGTPAGEPEPVR
jgi:Polysaccharide pyruvyl transferase